MNKKFIFYITILSLSLLLPLLVLYSNVFAKEEDVEEHEEKHEITLLNNEMYGLMKKGTFDVGDKKRLEEDKLVYYVSKTEDGLYKYKEVNTEKYLYNYTFFEIEDLDYLEALYIRDFKTNMVVNKDILVKNISPDNKSDNYIEKELKKGQKVKVLNLIEDSKHNIYAKIELSDEKTFYILSFYLEK